VGLSKLLMMKQFEKEFGLEMPNVPNLNQLFELGKC
jgi:hypothetical protein